MVKILTIIIFALLITGVATAMVCTLPIISQANTLQTQNENMIQSQIRFRIQDCSQSGNMTQLQQRLRLRCYSQNCNCEGACPCNQGNLGTAMGNNYQNQFCEQVCLQAQNRNRFGVDE